MSSRGNFSACMTFSYYDLLFTNLMTILSLNDLSRISNFYYAKSFFRILAGVVFLDKWAENLVVLSQASKYVD